MRQDGHERGPDSADQSGIIAISLVPADDARSVQLIAELDADLARNYEDDQRHGLHPGEERDPRLHFFLLEHDGVAAGCGAIRELEPGVAELKRMYVRPGYRGRGLSRRLLTELERQAALIGVRRLCLETGPLQHAALALYRSAGYAEIPAYGEYIGSPVSICMERMLAADPGVE